MTDENKVLRVRYGDGSEAFIRMGAMLALLRARGAYVTGRIELDDLERELDRLLPLLD